MKRVRLKRMGASPKGEALRRPAKGPKLPPRNPKRGSKGARHQGPKDLMEAILAGEQSGEEARGRGGLAGYFYRLIHTEPRLFAALLGRLLSLEARDPRQIVGKDDEPNRVYKSEEEVREALRKRGIPVDFGFKTK